MSEQKRNFLQITLLALFLAILIVPGYIFFSSRGEIGFLHNSSFQEANRRVFPLFGLYAFTLLWVQFMIGSNMPRLRRVFRGIESFHRKEGIFVLLLAFLHPTLLFIGLGPAQYLQYRFVDSRLLIFVLLGYFQLFLVTLTVSTALLRKLPWLKNHWHLLHYLNYVLFTSVWIHSWNLGSDVQSTSLHYLWIFFGVTAVLSVFSRLGRVVPRK